MEEITLHKSGINRNQLKLIAIFAMTLDHVLCVVWPGYKLPVFVYLLHAVGRLTAPIMCFFIAEGYHYTHDVKKYAVRLFLFALVSHFAYNFAFGIPFIPFKTGIFNQTSIMWALAWGLVTLVIQDSTLKQWKKTALTILICIIAFPSDWSSIAIMFIVGFASHRGNFRKQSINLIFYAALYAIVYMIFINVRYGLLQMCVVLALPLLYRYNGEKGRGNWMKWFFYLYYPLHLFLVGLLRLYLHGNIGVMVGGQ